MLAEQACVLATIAAVARRIPSHLLEEARAVEAEIRRAFAGVSREGGISWSEAHVIDAYGTEEERAVARLQDREQSWEELVDDPDWWHPDVMTQFIFVDPIGFRYYLPPAMIRALRAWSGEFLCYHLAGLSKRRRPGPLRPLFLEQFGILSSEQAGAVARFLRLMYRYDRAIGDEVYAREWSEAYHSYWRRFDPDQSPLE